MFVIGPNTSVPPGAEPRVVVQDEDSPMTVTLYDEVVGDLIPAGLDELMEEDPEAAVEMLNKLEHIARPGCPDLRAFDGNDIELREMFGCNSWLSIEWDTERQDYKPFTTNIGAEKGEYMYTDYRPRLWEGEHVMDLKHARDFYESDVRFFQPYYPPAFSALSFQFHYQDADF
jgi:hypothetical protein